MAYSVKYGSYTFNETYVALKSWGWDDNTRISSEIVSQRDGEVLTEATTRDKKVFRIEGRLRGDSAADAQDRMDALQNALNIQNVQFSLNGGTRYLNVYKSEFNANPVRGSALRVFDFTIRLEALDPYWYEAEQSSDQVIACSGLTFTINNPGAERVYPVITLLANQGGNITSALLLNNTTGKSWGFSGTVLAANNLVVNHKQFTVENNAVNQVDLWTPTFFTLAAGNNTLEFIGSNCTVRVAFVPRFNAPDWS